MYKIICHSFRGLNSVYIIMAYITASADRDAVLARLPVCGQLKYPLEFTR